MKIAFLTNEYAYGNLPKGGGVATFLRTIAQELDGKGHTVYVLGFSKVAADLHDGNVRLVFKKAYFKRYLLMEVLRSVCNSLKLKGAVKSLRAREKRYIAESVKAFVAKHPVDLIESHAYNGFGAYWDNSIPLVIRFHGSKGFDWKFRQRDKNEVTMWFERKALLNTPYIIAVSQFSGRAINAIYGTSISPTVIYNGIDTSVFVPKTAEIIPRSLFYVGTLSDAKGLPLLCEVFNIIAADFPDATWHIIGRNSHYFEDKIKPALSAEALARVTYYGEKQLGEIPDLIARAAVCAIPSRNETFGLVYVEAMAMKKLVVASNNDVVGEIISHGETGFIANDAAGMAECIAQVFNNPEVYEKVKETAREFVLDNFTKEAMTEKSLTFYRKMLSQV